MSRFLDTIRSERERGARPLELGAIVVAELVIVCLVIAVAVP